MHLPHGIVICFPLVCCTYFSLYCLLSSNCLCSLLGFFVFFLEKTHVKSLKSLSTFFKVWTYCLSRRRKNTEVPGKTGTLSPFIWMMFKIKFSRCLQIFYITQMFCAMWVKINMLFLGNVFLRRQPKKMEFMNASAFYFFLLFISSSFLVCFESYGGGPRGVDIFSIPSSYHCTSLIVPKLQSFPAFPPRVLNHALTLTWRKSHKKLSVLKVWLLIPVTQNPHAELRNDKGPLGPDSHLTYLGFPKG